MISHLLLLLFLPDGEAAALAAFVELRSQAIGYLRQARADDKPLRADAASPPAGGETYP